MSIAFLSFEDLLILHRHEVAKHGGDIGLRDEGLLRSAISQPQATFSGEWLHEFPHGHGRRIPVSYLFEPPVHGWQ